MKRLFKYLIIKYLKYFLIIFLSLELFYIAIDFLNVYHKIPNSANLQVIYLSYLSLYATNYTVPLAIIISFIVTNVNLIKKYELVAIYSIGYSQQKILFPFLIASIFITLLFIVINTTSLAYSKEKMDSILQNKFFSNSKNSLFFKYNDNYVYFGELFPIQKKAINVKIFKIKDSDLVEIIESKEAYFIDNKWKLLDVKVTLKPKYMDINSSKLEFIHFKTVDTLSDFKPKFLDSVYEAKINMSIVDTIYAIKLLKEQNLNTDKLRAVLYSKILFPLFAPLFIVIIFFYTPILSRFLNLALYSSIAIFSSLSIWGVLFGLHQLSLGASISPEIGILTPMVLLFIITITIYYLKSK